MVLATNKLESYHSTKDHRKEGAPKTFKGVGMKLIEKLKSSYKPKNVYSLRVSGVYPFLARIIEFGDDYMKVVDGDDVEFLIPVGGLATIRDVTDSPAHEWKGKYEAAKTSYSMEEEDKKGINNIRHNTGL